MKRYSLKKWAIAGAFLLTVPVSVLAQDKGDKSKSKTKDRKDMEQIIITRTGDADQKTVIEINGDKVLVNGAEVKDRQGDVTVRRHKVRDANAVIAPRGGWSFNMDDDLVSLFQEDENRAMLGVITEEDDKGARIESVSKESAAEKAGLKAGDIITRIDDETITDTDDVSEAVRNHKPGEKITITILRDGKEQKLTAELGAWKGVRMNAFTAPRVYANPVVPGVPGVPEVPGVRGFQGDVFHNLNWGGAPKLGLSIQDNEDGDGVKVLEVDEESNAAKAGLKEGDVITHVDDTEIKGVDMMTTTVRASRSKSAMKFKVQRDGKTQTIEVRVPKRIKTADL